MLKIFSTIFTSQEKLEKWTSRLEYLSLIFVACTILFGGLVIKFRQEIGKIDKKEKDKLNLTIAKLDSSSKQLENKNLALKDSIEQEKMKRLKLEKDISPRQIKNRSEWIKKLSKYQDMTVVVQHIPEIESIRFAERISSTFRDAHWKVIQQPPDEILPYIDGILVEHQVGAFIGYQENNEITDTIVNLFKKNGIDASTSPSNHGIPNYISIKVGFKPPIKDKDFKIITIDPK